MNSSPPPPSFTLPPLTAAGRLPISPDESPTVQNGDSGDYISSQKRVDKGKGKAVVPPVDDEDEVRISMYVRLFDEMINTVLSFESYLFTARELWVLKHILSLPYEPHYLLTRLLLRRPCKIHPFVSLVGAYSAELGDEGVKRAMRHLASPLPFPPDLVECETPDHPPLHPEKLETPIQKTSNPYPTPVSMPPKAPKPPKSKKRSSSGKIKTKPWTDLPTGLSAEEEKADPELAEAIRESLWASRVGRVEIGDDGEVVSTPPPIRPSASRSVSDASSKSHESSTSTSSVDPPALHADFTEEFSLSPKPPPPILVLARDEANLNLDHIMSCISAEDLRRVAKARKVPSNLLLNREAVCNALRSVAKQQTTLGFTPVKGKTTPGLAKQATLPFGTVSRVTSESLLIAQLLPMIGGHALQLSEELHSLIARVNLIFSRTPPSTAGGSSLMLPSILVSSRKRKYPDYGPPTRSIIWANRNELLVWERVTHWEAVVGDALGDSWQEQRKAASWGGPKRFITNRVEGAKIVKRVWESVWPVWQELVAGDGGEKVDAAKEEGGLVGDRFKAGHILTRIVYKSAAALSILHEYETECEVLRALLRQRRWRQSKRGAWYERLALVLMNHFNASPEEKEAKRREATQICIDGLLDEDTHLIYRPGLSHRLTRLEKALNLPADERHISYAELMECEIRELTAPRVKDNLGQAKIARPAADYREREGTLGPSEDVVATGGIQQVGKSVWAGRDGEVTVEGWVLEWWEKKGYKGFHSEGSIVTTLFALLLWPIIFHPLPGAFETPYQTAPLDLGEDTFAPARSDLLEERLAAMSKTKTALEMLREVDDRERPRQTWAVGVSWEYGKDDLEEILECLGGKAMAGICRMLAEEYRHRVSGVPDLLVWNNATKEVRFVEVKGPGDHLSETQKVWIDVLLSTGVQVEVCKVKAKDLSAADEKRLAKAKGGSVANGEKRRTKKEEDEELLNAAKEEMQAAGEQEEAEDEWVYESGEEGKAEGHWEREGKRVKVG